MSFCDTGFRNVPAQELNIPAYLEMLGIPYTGAPPSAMVICFDKAIVRLVAQSHTASRFRGSTSLTLRDSLEALPEIDPALIKPNAADGSVGITKDTVFLAGEIFLVSASRPGSVEGSQCRYFRLPPATGPRHPS